eukprot:CAMPEP_0172567072 /NCGR_PEP_ID=MMETSP1067-20121228/114483_1 /TAXON_ID=265564 ORGANISM="Thalassiosira punctigera, Strain Tpunct2005C2" /NCGR_SAMPLE_ID=MMETSP1067 /ASSEMBLY_ACC=CAM_ASM_000444 /LENGTH=31 /DNA_ID= /DNA_START= /DNA_END= /DNA_ORIENTATION=
MAYGSDMMQSAQGQSRQQRDNVIGSRSELAA